MRHVLVGGSVMDESMSRDHGFYPSFCGTLKLMLWNLKPYSNTTISTHTHTRRIEFVSFGNVRTSTELLAILFQMRLQTHIVSYKRISLFTQYQLSLLGPYSLIRIALTHLPLFFTFNLLVFFTKHTNNIEHRNGVENLTWQKLSSLLEWMSSRDQASSQLILAQANCRVCIE